MKVVGSGPTMLFGVNVPCRPVRSPLPVIVTIDPGAIPDWKLAPLTKAMLVGPGSRDVSENTVENPLADAVTVIGPALAPAVTVVEAWPVESVVTVEDPSVAEPFVTAKLTWAPPTPLPFASVTFTTTGDPNAELTSATCALPETC